MPWEPLPRARDAEPARVSDSLDRLVRNLGGPSADVTTSGANSRPVRLRNGTLTVAVADPAWATQLRFLEATLITRLQVELGASAVSTIEVRVRPEALRNPPGNAQDRR